MRTLIVALGLCGLALASAAQAGNRTLEFVYEVNAPTIPSGEPVDIYVPLPVKNRVQRILNTTVDTGLQTREGSDLTHGNRYLHLHRPANDDRPLTARIAWTVQRSPASAGGTTALAPAQRERHLAPDSRVPVGHEILDPILTEIRAASPEDSAEARARAIYDWVVDNVEYKKVGQGWGNGDTFWACNERYGNCTDFHALYISLARTEGIPARFEIGFPIPADRKAGEIGGYHCWVQYHLPGRGWVPIDASEAAKHPHKRELFYGNQPADRIHFTTGRDLVLSAASESAPLNYFIYPHVEVGGEPWQAAVSTRFSYRELETAAEGRPAGAH